jgi:hypothetical protein
MSTAPQQDEPINCKLAIRPDVAKKCECEHPHLKPALLCPLFNSIMSQLLCQSGRRAMFRMYQQDDSVKRHAEAMRDGKPNVMANQMTTAIHAGHEM